jgi:integrase
MSDLKTLAHQLVTARTQHGADDRYIKSIGTERSFRSCLSVFLEWRQHAQLPLRGPFYKQEMYEYLAEQAEVLSQKALDQHRQALQIVFSVQLKRFQSIRLSSVVGKDLTRAEIEKILSAQSERIGLSTLLCLDAGLRAAELFSISSAEIQPISPHRSWRDDLFAHRAKCRPYTVWGKGGLRRAVAISEPIAARLEQLRLSEPRLVIDREVKWYSRFDVVGGQSFPRRRSEYLAIQLVPTRCGIAGQKIVSTS